LWGSFPVSISSEAWSSKGVSVFISNSVENTVSLGERLGKLAQPGDFIALIGELGAGKTHFTQGFAWGLGVTLDVCVSSPSYTLMNEYRGRIPLYHFDLYRLGGDADIRELGFDEYFYGQGVCVVEWADRLCLEIPDEYLKVVIDRSGDETNRRIVLFPCGARYEKLVQELATEANK
jgi:tRNA threonylcarbamoyladenosine biosynthesis protein TsaE